MTTPSAKFLSAALAAAALVLWAFAGWTWWVLLPLFIASLVVRMVVWLFFEPWKDWAGPAVLVVVIVYLMARTSVWEQLLAFGVLALAVAWHLRLASPKWVRWVALGLGLAMVLGGGLAEFVIWANARALREKQWQQQHEEWLNQARPDNPGELLNVLTDQIVDGTSGPRKCFEFSEQAAQQFYRAHGQTSCNATYAHLSKQVTNEDVYRNYASASWSEAIEYEYGGHPRRTGIDLCHLEFSNIFDGNDPDAGPQIGYLVTETPDYGGTGQKIIEYRPCE